MALWSRCWGTSSGLEIDDRAKFSTPDLRVVCKSALNDARRSAQSPRRLTDGRCFSNTTDKNVNAKLKCPLFSKVEMSPFCSSDFSLLREEKTCCLSCGVVGERRASVGSRWATRGGNARSMASRPSALSTGCPHAPKGARRSAGLVHKSTASAGARGFHPPAATLAAAGLNGRRQGWSGGGL